MGGARRVGLILGVLKRTSHTEGHEVIENFRQFHFLNVLTRRLPR